MDIVDGVERRGGREGSPSQFAWREGRAPDKVHAMMGRAWSVNHTQQQFLKI